MKILLLSLVLMMNPAKEQISPDTVYQYCVEVGIKYPEIVTAQSILETGWYKCNNCSMTKNNIFGFTTGGPYIKFDDWKASVDYYKKWQDKHYSSERNYYDFLQCLYKTGSGRCVKYAQDLNYRTKLQQIVSKHENSWKKQ